MKKLTGFTLVELMITVAIIGITMTIGLPKLQIFMQANQLVAASNELLSSLHLARSEAIKLNSRVSICATGGGTDCAGSDWSKGWMVFVDRDGNGDMKGTGAPCVNDVNTDCTLRIHGGFTDTLLSVSGVDTNAGSAVVSGLTFTSRGLPKTSTGSPRSANFAVCSFDSSNTILGSRAVILSISGRVRVSDTDNPEVITCPTAP